MANILERIITQKRLRLEQQGGNANLETYWRSQSQDAKPTRGFARALQASVDARHCGVIAEIKQASPSAGVICANFDPILIAKSYEMAHAACLSVLTEADFFHGEPAHLQQARNACTLPVLRKDFIVEPCQVYETRAIGSDAMLLIAAVLPLAQLQALALLGQEIGLDVVVEVHSPQELEQTLTIEGVLLGINNRNLQTMQTSIENTLAILPLVPEHRLVISESGIHEHWQVQKLMDAGVRAFLVGESLMRADAPGQRLGELFFPASGFSCTSSQVQHVQ